MDNAFIGETFLQRTKRMKWLFLNTPSFKEWRLHFSLRLLRHFSLGFMVLAMPFSGVESSDVSLHVDLGWLEIILGAENSPY
ncbi:hypothetical protein LCGC14_2001180 [marine sediment metagenome]|uniref:Uncharacterized protein n=1 Tax=marine sediment metagenome TaxID=412755 RepID=A0A0F9F3F9_9ZZZZ